MFELDIARRHVVSNRRGTSFTLISVAIAVGIIIMSLGLTEGVRMQIVQDTIDKNPHLIINPKNGENYITMYRTISDLLWAYPETVALSPRLVGQGAARFMNKVQGVEFYGVNPAEENLLMSVQESMISGNFSDLRFNKNGAIIGVKLAQNLGIRPGGEVYLSLKNRSAKLKVIGLLQKGTVADSTLVYISLETAQLLVGEGDVVSEIGVKLSDFNVAPAVASDLNGKTRYKTTSWQDFNKQIAQFVSNQTVTNTLFYIFILLISAFVIANTTIMVVSRRKKEIGILMAMGASRRSILKIFLLENMLIGIPAGVLGCLLGLGLAKLITLLPMNVTGSGGGTSSMIIVSRPEYFAYAMIFALALNFISGIYPAYTAAILDPVEAIESE
jgi:lipoprotein-releasing system permease protein